MSDSNESSRQATHAKQEGVDDNVAALSGPVVDDAGTTDLNGTIGSGGVTGSGGDTEQGGDPAVSSARWSSAVNAAPPAKTGTRTGAESTGRWVAAAGIGSAALVAALLYANRSPKPGAKPLAKPDRNDR